MVCVWWTRKRKKERERAALSEETTANNQAEPLQSNNSKANRDRDVPYECKKLMGPADRTCNEADEEEEGQAGEGEQEEEEWALGARDKRPPQRCSVAEAQNRGFIFNGSGPVKVPHRTPYSLKDNRCKHLNSAKLSENVNDHYV